MRNERSQDADRLYPSILSLFRVATIRSKSLDTNHNDIDRERGNIKIYCLYLNYGMTRICILNKKNEEE